MTDQGPDHDISFACMGSTVRLLIGPAMAPNLPSPAEAARSVRAYLEDFDRRLSRFRPESELCQLNRDPRRAVPASALLRAAVRAGVWAAEATDGLVDPTLVSAIERAGYARSRRNLVPAPIEHALAVAPTRNGARPDPASRWQAIEVDDEAEVVRRPFGVAIDTGGTGKGLAADAVAHRLRGYSRFVVDCGGDIRIGGPACSSAPYEIEVEHPLTRDRVRSLVIRSGGIATSGLSSRIWEDGRGGHAHHLLDPSTGQPAWTGLVAVTALAPTALEAETLAKASFLRGPEGARELLAEWGGQLVLDDGRVEPAGCLNRPRRLHVRLPSERAA
jgi:thiamine biosynthesis lipoprotein